jgi:hypothetical protein
MWKQLWTKWTIDKPAAFGDWLWDVFVVQLAAWLDRLTLRHVITLVLVLILFLAYLNRIPLHPGLVLVGDMLAYIDIFAALFLLSILSRFTTLLFVAKQMSARVLALARGLRVNLRRLDFRHRREGGAKARRRPAIPTQSDDEDGVVCGLAWA